MPPTSPSPQPTTFLSLSSELRNSIYTLVLTSPNPLTLERRWSDEHGTLFGLSRSTPGNLTPQLLSTTHQIHAEAAPILYGSNMIILRYASWATIFFYSKQIARYMRYLRRVEISESTPDFAGVLGPLERSYGLRQLVLSENGTSWGGRRDWGPQRDPVAAAEALTPLVKALYRVRKDKGEVLGVLDFWTPTLGGELVESQGA